MFLKRIEIIGFKSFPEKTVLSFEAGTTAIVGPNGCGKSNVADAIKWVVGEQSAKSLRGGSMQDVIFNGSSAIKPLGMAEVSLVLDNSEKLFPIDYSEIKITRKLYRSGESDYLINKKRCRLKDITDLLMDTGLGSDSYCVIEQGRMDKVLNARPEDRRSVFEEAAGITKYKARRKEALRKLERTSENLLRVSDITSEVKKQMNSIERQANKAKRYQEFFTELKNLEIIQSSSLVSEIELKQQTSLSGLDEVVLQEQAMLAQKKEHEQQLELLSQDLMRVEEEFIKTNRDIANNRAEEEIAANLIKNLQEKLVHGQENIEQMRLELIQKNEDVQKFDQELGDGRLQLEQANGVLSEKQALLEHYQAQQAQIQKIQQEQEQALKELVRMQDELDRKREECRLANVHRSKMLEGMVQKQKDLDLLLVEKNEQKTVLKAEILAQEEKLQQQSDALKGFELKKDQLLVGQTQVEQHIEQLQEWASQKRSQISSHQSQLKVLQEMQQNYEGYARGAREILKKRDRGDGVYGRILSDLASVLTGEVSYQAAIGVAIDSVMQSVIVRNMDDFKAIVEDVRLNDMGRVSLVALDSLLGHSVVFRPASSLDVLQQPGVIDFALNKVQCSQEYRSLAEAVLSRVVIVETLEAAFECFKRYAQEGFSYVTVKGEFLNASGIVSLGQDDQQAETAQIFGRKNKIEQLEKTIRHLEQEQSEIDLQLSSKKEQMRLLKEEIRSNEEQLDRFFSEVHHSQNHLSRFQTNLQHLSQKISDIGAELEQLVIQRQDICADMEKASGEEQSYLGEVDHIQRQKLELSNRLNQIELDYDDCRSKFVAIQIEIASHDEKQKRIASQVRFFEQAQKEALARIERLNVLIGQVSAQISSYEEEMTQVEARKQAFSEESVALLSRLEDVQSIKQEITLETREISRLINDVQTNVSAIKDQKQVFELKKNECQYELASIQKRMKEFYDLSWEEVLSTEVQPVPEGTDFVARIDDLKSKIHRMGPVNPEAIHEYDELKERFDFLTKQIDDLTESKENLHKVISEINKESKKRFKEAFDQTRANFQDLYKRLFGGGHADIFLLDENDLLESGIEITACPPGKKPQTISLLSGGEKAMTGIALLFAMFMVKPSPFCVLDEIDAPLDESNIDRFADMMDSFNLKTQFIVITHSKKTMAKADIIYGITMQKPGISKPIAIKLTEYQERKQETVDA